MSALGLAMLQVQKRAPETAEARRLDKSTSDSGLAVTARGLQDAIERALGFHARYLRLDDGGSITINRDFEHIVMDAATMTAWGGLATALSLPAEVVLQALQEGGRLPADTDVGALALEMMAGQQAKEEAERLAREESLAAAQMAQKPKPPVVAGGAGA
jgi:hypothetical protein